MEAILFWIFSLGMIVAGIGVVLSRNPVASALSLAVSIVFLALMYGFCLNAWFLMVIQVAVYAGAVMVLFLFIIMLLDIKEEEKRTRGRFYSLMGSALALFLMAQFIAVLLSTEPVKAAVTAGGPVNDDAHVIGTLLFTKYLLPFEITSILLLVAAVGVVLLSLKRESSS
ncbi:MAG: NADH-quinone oxidoreductase subunit J [Candidatus Methylacidiphilales bacterium]|nr:NADH-quinone oxidoreductase subunit J [Candidatus Methylacidiphilales bacterium]